MRARTGFVLSCLMVWLCAEGSASAEGKLARARREASSSSSSSSSSSDDDDDDSRSERRRHRHHDHHHHDHDHDDSSGLVGAIVCGFFGGCDGDSGYYETESSPPVGYSSYPYASPLSPYLLETQVQVASTSPELDAQLRLERAVGRPYAGHVMLDAGYFAGVGHGGLDARLLTPSPFELGARTSVLWEPAARDYSLFGAGELGLRFAELRPFTARAIAGAVFFGRPGEMLLGVELGLGIDVFLGRPWVLSARLAGGVLGETLIPQARVQLGYLFGRSELFVAYQYLQIGSVDLSAPLLGMRLWL